MRAPLRCAQRGASGGGSLPLAASKALAHLTIGSEAVQHRSYIPESRSISPMITKHLLTYNLP